MGGLLRAPKVPNVAVAAAPAPAPQPAAAAPVVTPPAAPAPVAASTDSDPDGIRRRRGLAATIATSDRGLIDSGRIVPSRKTLLGE